MPDSSSLLTSFQNELAPSSADHWMASVWGCVCVYVTVHGISAHCRYHLCWCSNHPTIFASKSLVCVCVCVCVCALNHSVVSDSMRPHRLYPTRLLCPWDSPGKNTGVGCHALLQGTFPTQGSNPGLSHCKQILYQLSYQGSPGSPFSWHLSFVDLLWYSSIPSLLSKML